MSSRLNQFPQPTRPTGSLVLSNEEHAPQDMFVPQCSDHGGVPVEPQQAPPTATTEEEGQEDEEGTQAIDELRRSILQIYERLPAGIRSQLTSDEMKALTSLQKDLKVPSASRRGREGSVEELKHKLERFKIRTLVLAGAAKGEQKR